MDDWDPLAMAPADMSTLTPQCSYRLKKDLKSILEEPLEGILVEPDETHFLRVHALVTGTPGTPYEKGFFYFMLGFPKDYPFSPPRVRFMTTSAGKVRFNPNLYASGKVCLSILGTYFGPKWTAAQGLKSVLLSIQSILNEKPYSNEPGYEKERRPGDSETYNCMIRHHTIEVAVIGMVKNECKLSIPEKFQSHIRDAFLTNYDFYESTILGSMMLTGKPIEDTLYCTDYGSYKYDFLLDSLESTKSALLAGAVLK